jgi:hypothetical protein
MKLLHALCPGLGGRAGSRTAIGGPGDPKGVQNQVVRERQFLRVHNRLVGIVDQGVASNAPGFVTNYARTVLARGFGVVLIAVKDRAVERNGNLAKLGGAFRLQVWRRPKAKYDSNLSKNGPQYPISQQDVICATRKSWDVGSADVPQAIDNVGTRSVVCRYQGAHQPNKGGHA